MNKFFFPKIRKLKNLFIAVFVSLILTQRELGDFAKLTAKTVEF